MAALQRFIPLCNIRRGVKIQEKVFGWMNYFLKQRQLLLINIDLNHTVYIQIIFWVGQHIPPPPWYLIENLIKKLKNR